MCTSICWSLLCRSTLPVAQLSPVSSDEPWDVSAANVSVKEARRRRWRRGKKKKKKSRGRKKFIDLTVANINTCNYHIESSAALHLEDGVQCSGRCCVCCGAAWWWDDLFHDGCQLGQRPFGLQRHLLDGVQWTVLAGAGSSSLVRLGILVCMWSLSVSNSLVPALAYLRKLPQLPHLPSNT